MFCSIFGLLSQTSFVKLDSASHAAGILKTANQVLAGQIRHAVNKLKGGGSCVVLTGESASTLAIVSAGLACIATSGSGGRKTTFIQTKCVGGSEDIRKLMPVNAHSLIVLDDISALKNSQKDFIYGLLDRFVKRGGSVVTSSVGTQYQVLPKTWNHIAVPNLSSRRSDALLIWNHLADAGLTQKILPATQTMLLRHNWSGGLAELIEAMDSARILSSRCERSVVNDSDMVSILKNPMAAGEGLRISEFLDSSGLFRQATEQGVDHVSKLIVAAIFAKALKQCNGNKRRAAELLGIPGSTLLSRIRVMQKELELYSQWA